MSNLAVQQMWNSAVILRSITSDNSVAAGAIVFAQKFRESTIAKVHVVSGTLSDR